MQRMGFDQATTPRFMLPLAVRIQIIIIGTAHEAPRFTSCGITAAFKMLPEEVGLYLLLAAFNPHAFREGAGLFILFPFIQFMPHRTPEEVMLAIRERDAVLARRNAVHQPGRSTLMYFCDHSRVSRRRTAHSSSSVAMLIICVAPSG